jgi:hypothetical protein
LSAIVVTDEMQDMLERKQQFTELLVTLYSSEPSESSKEEVAAQVIRRERVYQKSWERFFAHVGPVAKEQRSCWFFVGIRF